MSKIDWFGLYRDELKIEVGVREKEIKKLLIEVNIYKKVIEDIERVITNIEKVNPNKKEITK